MRLLSKLHIYFLIIIILLFATGAVYAGQEMKFSLSGIKSPSSSSGLIDVRSYGLSISESANSEEGVHSCGLAKSRDFMVIKALDDTSAALHKALKGHNQIDTVKFYIKREVSGRPLYLLYTLSGCTISYILAVDTSKDVDRASLEEVRFKYGCVSWEYLRSDPSTKQ